MKSERTRRWGKFAVLAILVVGSQLIDVPGARAAAPPTLEQVPAFSPLDSVSPKTAIASCPVGKRVMGGGGEVAGADAATARRVVLTRLEPVHSGSLGSYVVTGEEVAPGTSGTWAVAAYAICAPSPAGYEIVSESTRPSSSLVQQNAADCPGSKEVIGTGSQINNPGGQVTLQLNRADGLQGISRVTAKERPVNYLGTWNVISYAVCTNPLAGFSPQGSQAARVTGENEAIATVTCPPGTFVHGAAAATSNTESGLTSTPPGVAIQRILPFAGLTSVQAIARETFPTDENWDLVANAICGP